jgi:phosphatidate cytidylyltransferase
MSNLVQRLLLFFIGIPLILAIIVFLPQHNHAAIVVIIVFFCGGCAIELAVLFRSRGDAPSPALFAAIGAGLPLSAFAGGLCLDSSFLGGSLMGFVIATAAALILCCSRFALSRVEEIHAVLPKASALAFTAVYPGLFGSFIVLIAAEPLYATESIISFALFSFINDSLAWFFGVTLGRNRGIVAVSPNKSAEGFIGGMAGSIGMAFACSALFPGAVGAPWWKILAWGFLVGVAVILGDLFESALKRSVGAKDSGSAVPGRGGFLDSFDSLLFAAPVFYGLCLAMGFFR